MKCLVSGATGFIGRQLCQQLVARGDTVVALSRHGAPLWSGEATLALDLVVNDPAPDLLQGVDVFFHLAAIAHRRAPRSDYNRLNYHAAVRLARLASAAGIGTFVFLSSVKAMGPPSSKGARSESACSSPIDAYGLSKWEAECALREQFCDASMSVVIVRPALVYGAKVKGNLQKLASGVRWGLPRPPAGGARSMLALDDLIELLCLIANDPPPAGVHTWIACGSDSYSTQEMYDLLREAVGRRRGRQWWPRWVWQAGARMLDVISGSYDDSTYDKLFGTELYSNATVLRDTTWRPRTRLEDVIRYIAAAGSADA